jgi:hypothetical protein
VENFIEKIDDQAKQQEQLQNIVTVGAICPISCWIMPGLSSHRRKSFVVSPSKRLMPRVAEKSPKVNMSFSNISLVFDSYIFHFTIQSLTDVMAKIAVDIASAAVPEQPDAGALVVGERR